MRRREVVAGLMLPLLARGGWAQQSTMPVIGYLSGLSAEDRPSLLEMFRYGLSETGYIVGRNVMVEYRFADNDPERLRPLASELIARQVAVIAATGGNNSGLAAKALTPAIPIVFTSGADPVRAGLVSSLSRPEANITGVSFFSVDMGPKHFELLRALLPGAARVALMINPSSSEAALYIEPAQEAARTLALELLVLKAPTIAEIEPEFEKAVQQKASALIVAPDPNFAAHVNKFVSLAARHSIPVLYPNRDYVAAGGLMSYGNDIADAYRRAGIYVGRILKGAKPADLPVDRATKFELVINLKTAKALGIDVAPTLLARADEVIE